MRKACAVIKLSRFVYLYKSNASDNSALVMRMKEITLSRVHYGSRRVHVILRREGFRDNHKRVYRLYREQGWSLRQKRPKRNKAVQLRQPTNLALHINQIWSMDFVADH
jgi:putative transposase